MSDCSRCYYGFMNHCAKIRREDGCFECDNFDQETLQCRCTNIEDTADCPYFKDAYNEEDNDE